MGLLTLTSPILFLLAFSSTLLLDLGCIFTTPVGMTEKRGLEEGVGEGAYFLDGLDALI
jgi:hypothetical protein